MVDIDYLQSHLGPIDFIAVEIPDDADVATGMRHILDLVDQHTIRVIDFEFVSRDASGVLGTISPTDIRQHGGCDFSVFEGASSGPADGSDFEEVAATLQAVSIAAILVYEELALLPALAAFEAVEAAVIGTGPIDEIEPAEVLGDE
jgi:hypothetical protein